jgi:protein-disulfide isomerase
MTYGIPGDDGLSRNERREAAREKAKTIRDQQRKKEKRSRLLVQGGILLALVAIATTVTLVLVTTANRPQTPGPRNMLSDGILIGEGFVAKPTAALQPGASPVANVRDDTSGVIAIQLFVDYFCPVCGTFEETNGDQISTLVESGAATVEIFPYAILDSVSQGTKYSTRAANAAACVADSSPDTYFEFNRIMFANQPEEGTGGLSDEELTDLTVKAGVSNATTIAKCIKDQKFKDWVADAKERHRTEGVPNSNVTAVGGTPTVIVNGVKYTGALNDQAAFNAFILQAANDVFNESSTSTPTPTATPEG